MERLVAMAMGGTTANTIATAAAVPANASIAHGGRLAEARALFPSAPEPFIDLSTGINPVPYPIADIPAAVWSRLPEPDDLAGLEAAAASAYGTSPARVVAAPGTQILISVLPRIFPLRSVAIVGPTYAEHAVAWAEAGANVKEIKSLDQVTNHDVVVLCNPNNPDGRRYQPDLLAETAGALARRGGLLIVDEAFADLEEGPLSLIPDLPPDGAIVLRSFGKTYGLAGLRLGFAVVGEWLADPIRQALGPWAVSGPAIAIGREALADDVWRDATSRRLEGESRRLDEILQSAGLRIAGGTRLFRLAEGGDTSAIFERLGQAGIYVRRFAVRPQWLRFGMPGSPEAWERLTAALG